MARSIWKLLARMLITAFSCVAALGDPSLPALISDHMVLQQGVPIPIWGKAAAGEKIEVTLGAGPARATTASETGDWKVSLDPLRPGGPFTMTIRGARTIVV